MRIISGDFKSENTAYDGWFEYTFAVNGRPSLLSHDPFPGLAYDIVTSCATFFRTRAKTALTLRRADVMKAFCLMPGIDGYLGLLSSGEIEWARREELAVAQTNLFSDLFTLEEFSSVSFLWWERLVGASFNDGPAVYQDVKMCECLINVLTDILSIPSGACQMSALHGLHEIGGAADIAIGRTVAEFVASGLAASPGVLAYAKSVETGDVQ